MSEQNQTNVQALGAGLLGFAVVMAVGGGALMVHSSRQSKVSAKPVAAAEPIDIGAAMPRSMTASPRIPSERRAESPAPLLGAEEEAESVGDAPAESAEAATPEAAPTERTRLQVSAHVETARGGSTAQAVVKNTIVEEKAVSKAKPAVKKRPVKLDAAGGAEVVASVHYGVTSRNELMGRAAGPVYNIKGGGAVGGLAPKGKLAEDLNAKIADLKRQLDASGLPAEKRDQLLKELVSAQKAVPKTAQ